MLKLSDNPPIIFPEQAVLAEIPGQWWVAHTKARNEKALAQVLRQWDIPYFLPMREKTSIIRGRRHKSLLPLFSSYVFFAGDEHSRYQALTSNRIANVIEVVDQDLLVSELAQIQRAITSDVPLDPHPYLKVGTRCRIISGALLGLEGILVKKKNLTQLVLQVDILGQAVAVEVQADLLESLD